MLVDNLTSQDLYFGPLHLGPNVTGYYVDDTTATSLYLTSDVVADALNNAKAAGKIQVSGEAQPFPRPTGTPQILHGDGSPDGLVFAPQGSAFMRRDNSGANTALYAKTTGVTDSTGWRAFAEAAPVIPATTLPGTPADGQQAILVDSTSAPAYAWLLQWSAPVSKWLFLGGARYMITPANASSSAGNGVWQDKGAIFTFPRAGSWQIEILGLMGGNSAASSSTYGVGFSSPPPIQAPISWNLGNATASGGGPLTATASQVLHAWFEDNDSTRRNSINTIRVYITPTSVT